MLQELEKHNITKINPCIEFISSRINVIFKFHGGKLEDLTLWWNWRTIDILYWLVCWCVPVHAGLDFGGCNQAIQESNGLTPHQPGIQINILWQTVLSYTRKPKFVCLCMFYTSKQKRRYTLNHQNIETYVLVIQTSSLSTAHARCKKIGDIITLLFHSKLS